MNELEMVDPQTGTRRFVTPEEADRLGAHRGVERQAKQPVPLSPYANDRQAMYIQSLQQSLMQSKLEQEQADLDYNPSLRELGAGGQGSGQSVNLNPGTTRNITRTPGQPGQGVQYAEMSQADPGYRQAPQVSGQVTKPQGAGGQELRNPDMRLQELRRIANNIKGLPDSTQQTILGEVLGIEPEHVRRQLERMTEMVMREREKDQNRAETLRDRRGYRNEANMSQLYNRATGKTAADEGTDPYDVEQVAKDYIKLTPKQQEGKAAMEDLDEQVVQYRKLLSELGYHKTGAGTISKGLDLKRLSAIGDPRMARLEALHSKVGNLVKANGEDSRISDTERKLALAAVPGAFESAEGALAKLDMIDRFRDVRVDSLGLPWMRRERGLESLTLDEKIARLRQSFEKKAKASGGNNASK